MKLPENLVNKLNEKKNELGSKKYLVAIDYDDTFTTNKTVWTSVISLLRANNFDVICVSARTDSEYNRGVMSEFLPKIPLFLTQNSPKREFMLKRGFSVDIWVDDSPESIV